MVLCWWCFSGDLGGWGAVGGHCSVKTKNVDGGCLENVKRVSFLFIANGNLNILDHSHVPRSGDGERGGDSVRPSRSSRRTERVLLLLVLFFFALRSRRGQHDALGGRKTRLDLTGAVLDK